MPGVTGLPAALGSPPRRAISAPDGLDSVATLRRGSSLEVARGEDRQLTSTRPSTPPPGALEDCCGSILDRRIDIIRRCDLISIVASIVALGVWVLRAPAAGAAPRRLPPAGLLRPPHGHRRGVSTRSRSQFVTNSAQRFIRPRRLSNRSDRMYERSTALPTWCASAASATACGTLVCSLAQSRNEERKPCTVQRSPYGRLTTCVGTLWLSTNYCGR